ncbi:MMPL family transporter [candidate division KSB1 bacterium]|nr:MMPL family transporter [candidate division KSB1 bacterium]
MRDNWLRGLANYHVKHPWTMLTIVILITLLMGVLSEHLKITLRWSDLLPEKDPRTIEFNKIMNEFVSATSIVVVVQGDESQIKQFADELAPKLVTLVDTSQNNAATEAIQQLEQKLQTSKSANADADKINELETEITSLKQKINRPLIQRVDYKSDVDFLRNHGLMLMKETDLEDMGDIFIDPNLNGLLVNINNAMEKEYVGKSESISTREKEDGAVMFLDGIEGLVKKIQAAVAGKVVHEDSIHAIADKLLLGEPYFISYDEKALILNAIPNFTMFDTDLLVIGTDAVNAVINEQLQDYPGVTAGLTGFIPIGRDEMVYSQESLGYTSLIAIIAILALLVISFRMWIAPIFAMVTLIVGIIWAVGLSAVLVGQLNIMTQMMAVILMGLGIDFAIHLISAFTESRAAGDDVATAMEHTFLSSGKGVITGALTTAAAFLTMLISNSRGMKEMGIVTGAGLLAILVATLLFLPVLLVFRERRHEKRVTAGKKAAYKERDLSFRSLGALGGWLGTHYFATIMGAIIATFLLGWTASRITFDQNYMNIEPKGLRSIALQDTIIDKFDLGMDYAMILADSVEQSREYAEKCKDMGSVAITEDISFYLPSNEQQAKRKPYIESIRNKMKQANIARSVNTNALLDELNRMRMNIMEMQDMAFLGGQDKVDNKCKILVGDPDKPESQAIMQHVIAHLEKEHDQINARLTPVQAIFAPYFQKNVINMCNTTPIHLQDLPASILDRYSNRDRNQFLVTVYPAGNIWQDAAFAHQFVDDLERISPQATGMPPVFMALIEIIGRDGRHAMMLTLVCIFLLLWLDFRRPRYALIAMIPLAVGVVWMVGFMKLTGQQFTVLNVMGLPMILGIGIDDGVHIVHRWLHEGRGKIKLVYASTGKAILLTSLTTMLGFGSLVFSVYRGFGQLGASLFVGVGACFLTSALILPGILGFVEREQAE